MNSNQNIPTPIQILYKDAYKFYVFFYFIYLALTYTKNCVFCNKYYTMKKSLRINTIKAQGEAKKREIISALKASGFSEKSQLFETSTYINYHKTCLYQHSKVTSIQSDNILLEEIEAPSQKTMNVQAFEKLDEYIKDRIIKNRQTWAILDIYSLYKRLFQEEWNKCRQLTETIMKSQHLCAKILNANENVSKTLYRYRVFLHASDMSTEELLQKGFELEDTTKTQILNVGASIRKEILNIQKNEMPKRNITLKNVIDGECSVPEKLYTLIESIIESPRVNENTFSKRRDFRQTKIMSICSSIILTATSGECKPATCIQLALAVKSLTGSAKVLTMLNRLGFCPSYSVTEEIETELAFTCSIDKRILPYDFNTSVITNVAFDNYDRYVETSDGKNTLHDTVGIAVQNRIQLNEANPVLIDSVSIHDSNTNERRRRQYVSTFDSSLPALPKTDKLPIFLRMNANHVPENIQGVIDSHTIWMANYALLPHTAKKWLIFHSHRVVDQNPQQKVGYLPVINASPTSDAVVMKTMMMALDIADECKQDYIIVTYDLAIASKALNIKAQKSPQFDKLFINLGPFHIELSFFKVSILFLFIKRLTLKL